MCFGGVSNLTSIISHTKTAATPCMCRIQSRLTQSQCSLLVHLGYANTNLAQQTASSYKPRKLPHATPINKKIARQRNSRIPRAKGSILAYTQQAECTLKRQTMPQKTPHAQAPSSYCQQMHHATLGQRKRKATVLHTSTQTHGTDRHEIHAPCTPTPPRTPTRQTRSPVISPPSCTC